MYNDFLLIRRMKQGDDLAFDVFVHKYYKDILNYCHYHCGDREYAEDLTQETFVRFFGKLSDYRYEGKTKNYLYTISGNLCKDYFKKVKDIPVEYEELSNMKVEEQQMEDVLNKIVIEQVLGMLSNELHELAVLYYVQELKQTEIADKLQISLPLVKYRLRKAKMQLKELLGREGLNEYERKRIEF